MIFFCGREIKCQWCFSGKRRGASWNICEKYVHKTAKLLSYQSILINAGIIKLDLFFLGLVRFSLTFGWGIVQKNVSLSRLYLSMISLLVLGILCLFSIFCGHWSLSGRATSAYLSTICCYVWGGNYKEWFFSSFRQWSGKKIIKLFRF